MASLDNLINMIIRVPRDPAAPIRRQLLDPANTVVTPELPVGRQILRLQIRLIHRPQDDIQHVREAQRRHAVMPISQVRAAAGAEGARHRVRRLVEGQEGIFACGAGLKELDGRDPGLVALMLLALAGIGSRNGGRGDDFDRRAEPVWKHGAGGTAAVVAMVHGDEGEADFSTFALGVGEGVQGPVGVGWDLGFVSGMNMRGGGGDFSKCWACSNATYLMAPQLQPPWIVKE